MSSYAATVPTVTNQTCASGSNCAVGSLCTSSSQCATGNCCAYIANPNSQAVSLVNTYKANLVSVDSVSGLITVNS